MLITRECDYAVRVLRAMAEEKRVSVNEICEKELITAPFAYKILKKLQKMCIRDRYGAWCLEKMILYQKVSGFYKNFI